MTRADYIVVALAFLLLPFLYLTFWGNGQHGEQVVIRIAGHEAQHYPLSKNKKIKLEGPKGKSVIEISDGQVRFLESPCQGKQCILAGWLNKDGDVSACLPNGISIQVQGREARFDSVNF